MNAAWWARVAAPEILVPMLVAIFLGGLGIWYARRGPVKSDRQRDLSTSMRLLRVYEHPLRLSKDFACQFRGVQVRQVACYRYFFANTGHEPIVRTDFDSPLQLAIGGTGHVFDCKAAVCRPAGLPVQVSYNIDSRRIVIEPLLLNPGDFGSIDFIATDSPEITESGRIRGIKGFASLMYGTLDRFTVTFPWTLVCAGILVAAMPWFVSPKLPDGTSMPPDEAGWFHLATALLGLLVAGGGISLFQSWRSLRRARYLGPNTEPHFMLERDHGT